MNESLYRRAPLHDRGKVLVQTALMLAGGGESCADIEHLRCEEDLFGNVPSDSTVYRAFHELTTQLGTEIAEAVAEVRRSVWDRSAATKRTGPIYLDIDGSLVEIHSENKENSAPTFKGTFGFHPIFCFADATGDALSGLLRPGNAGSNTVADHVAVLDTALAQLPALVQAGHRAGDDPSLVERPVVVRTDSAGSTAGFVAALRNRNIGFLTVAATNRQIQEAIMDAEGIEQVWAPALCQDGEVREGAAVCELTELVDLSSWPVGTRLIVRREPLHPGAQRSLFPSLEHRYWGFYTDQAGEPVDLDVVMRAHAHVENHIERLKESGLCRFPFTLLAICPPEGTALGHLPRTRAHRLFRTAAHRAHPRRLAERRGDPLCLPSPRAHHLSEPGPSLIGTRLTVHATRRRSARPQPGFSANPALNRPTNSHKWNGSVSYAGIGVWSRPQ
jgi:hypothetical protein